MGAGQRKKEHRGSPNPSKHNYGIDPDGHNLHPFVCWSSSGYQQHIQREKAAQRFHIRGSRGTHGVTQICHHLMHFPLLILLPLFIHQVPKPSGHPYHLSLTPLLLCHSSLRLGAAGKRIPLEHRRQQAFLLCASSHALDLWPTACFLVLPHYGSSALQP
ncbi:hypothetical protein Goarm_004977 [Gossypium armourianum]|uniref:Uncharacterized protein n=1 Tax=Gossypium armourianum TaxID=34283 RepID=A0A7J9JYG0_9ROSI|nr:hypothetical protein [Gossypium armourianum]